MVYLLDTNGTHGLGAEFLTRFAIHVLLETPPHLRPLPLSDVALSDFARCLVLREHRHIDVLCVDDTSHFVLAIENKIDSAEHSQQLQKYRSALEQHYPKARRILAYLTPTRDEPSDDRWIPIGYESVVSILEDLVAKHHERLAQTLSLTLNHYCRMLRRDIVTDDDLVSIAKAMYQKHRVALDFLFEHRPDRQLDLSELAVDLLSSRYSVQLERTAKTVINFFPEDWKDIPSFNATLPAQWTKTRHTLLFEITNYPDSIRIALVIGPSNQNSLRKKIFDFSRKDPKRFPGGGKQITSTSRYTKILSLPLVDKPTLAREDTEEIKSKLTHSLTKFMDTRFPAIVDAMAKEFAEPP